MSKHSKSFFDRLTGSVTEDDDFKEDAPIEKEERQIAIEDYTGVTEKKQDWLEDEEEGQLTVDMFQTAQEIIIQAMVAGTEPDELDISIARDMITIKGKRQKAREITKEDYYYKELYWGSFSRSILLPAEIDTEGADASTKNGLLTIRLPKIDKDKVKKVKIKHK